MRISTQTLFGASTATLQRQQAEFLRIGQQLASGQRVLKPSDDPLASSRALEVSQSKAVAEQYAAARVGARNALSQQEQVLNSIGHAITSAKTLAVQAASDTLTPADRASIAAELRGILETVLGQANAADGNGRYLFGGFQDDSPPFVRDGAGAVSYVGDANARNLRIDDARLMAVGDNGITLFQTVQAGAGYVATAAPGNAGNLTFTGPLVLDNSAPDHGSAFTLEFSVAGDSVSYSVNGAPAQIWQAGEPVVFGGLSLKLDGVPAAGDSLVVAPSGGVNTDLFATLKNLVDALERPDQTATDKARLRNTLNTSMRELDNALDNILTVRASVGAKLNELDTVDEVAGNRILNYEQTLSQLVDFDLVKGISDYSLRQMGLEASQKAFVDITRMSLLNFL